MSVTATEARRDLYRLIQKVTEDRVPVRVTSRNHGNVVMMAEDDWDAWQETMYLFSNPANAARLRESFDNVASGNYAAHSLDEA
jgi:antitoxin YefM